MKGDRFQVLRIHKVAVKKHRYLPVKLLVYGDQSRRELELAVCIEDDLATDHGLALDRIEAVKRLGLSLGEAEPRQYSTKNWRTREGPTPQPSPLKTQITEARSQPAAVSRLPYEA